MADHFTEADGRQLAADMLRELGRDWETVGLPDVPVGEISEALISEMCEAMIARDPDTLRRFLRVVQEKGSPALERGFLCALNDYLGSSMAGGFKRDPSAYEERRHD